METFPLALIVISADSCNPIGLLPPESWQPYYEIAMDQYKSSYIGLNILIVHGGYFDDTMCIMY